MNASKINTANCLASIIVLGFILAGSANAQETVPAKSQSQEESKQQEGKPKSKEKVFKPSEEISEDSPVPFPVDI